jgi:hypothetical protein
LHRPIQALQRATNPCARFDAILDVVVKDAAPLCVGDGGARTGSNE